MVSIVVPEEVKISETTMAEPHIEVYQIPLPAPAAVPAKRTLSFGLGIFSAGVLQMITAGLGYFLYSCDIPAFCYFPQWGWGAFPGEVDDLQVKIGFTVEYLFGLLLLTFSPKRCVSKLGLGLWVWTASFLTFLYILAFLCKIPNVEYKSDNFYVALNMLLISIAFHLFIVCFARNHYTTYVEKPTYYRTC